MNLQGVKQKRCPKCGEIKPVEHFNRDRSRPDGLRPWCKACHAAQKRARYQALQHPDRLEELATYKQAQREEARRWRQNNPEKYREYNRRWRQNNPEKHRASHRRFVAAHPEYPRLYRAIRRALGNITTADFNRMWADQSGCCAYCHNSLDPDNHHIEHPRPISRGGDYSPENVCLSCPRCNLGKGTKTPEEWTNRWYENQPDEPV